MGAYRLKHKFVKDDIPQETEEFFVFQKTAKIRANSIAGSVVKWTKTKTNQYDYFLTSSPKENELFLIETIHFR